MRTYFLIPVYNETANLELLSENLFRTETRSEKFYVFVDDHSSDESVALTGRLFAGKPYHIITKDRNLGPGDSFNKGFEWILDNGADDDDLIITLEADNTSDFELIPDLVTISELGFNLVLPSVYAQGGGFQRSSFFRKLISFTANMFLRTAFNVKVQTLSSFFRLYRAGLIRKIRNDYTMIISEKGFVCMFEILLKAIRSEARIIEVPTVLRSQNRKDRSKMKVLRTTRQYLAYVTRIIFSGL